MRIIDWSSDVCSSALAPSGRRLNSVTRLASSRFADRTQLDLFRSVPGDVAARDAQDLMTWPFFSLAKSRRVTPIDFHMGPTWISVEAVPEHGIATIWDADVLIWAASQLVQARAAGRPTSRLLAPTTGRAHAS